MKPKYKIYLKLNIMSLAFVAVSFISVTLAWFAYSGLADVRTEVNIKAWNIELEKDGEKVSNDIVISLSDLYPGMNTVNEKINIKNLGDSDAQISYSIVSARILGAPEDNYIVNEEVTTSNFVEDRLSHDYPFHININLSKNYALAQGDGSTFEVSVSWPLDSESDELDSSWGSNAYLFQKNEEALKLQDANYQIRPSIQVIMTVTAEQYLTADTSSDTSFDLGNKVLFDVVSNSVCTDISTTCLETYVIDVNSTLGDDTVTLLPNPNNTYLEGSYSDYNTLLASITNGWTVSTRPLLINDILQVVSRDIMSSFLVRNGISDAIIGNLTYNNRINIELNRAISYNGYYKYLNGKYGYLMSNTCYWTNSEYDVNNGFAVIKTDEINSKVYNELKANNCKIVPVIIANKANL
ncbi:MAG: hypothetical protein ACM3O4_02835 [Ignavibacteriales bacterium]